MCLGHILMKTETSKWGPLSFYGLRLLWLCSACWRDGYDHSGIYFHIVSWWCMVYQSANSTCYWALCSLFKLGIQSNFRTVAYSEKYFDCTTSCYSKSFSAFNLVWWKLVNFIFIRKFQSHPYTSIIMLKTSTSTFIVFTHFTTQLL